MTITIIFIVAALVIYFLWKPKKRVVKLFPMQWGEILEENVSFYRHLDEEKRQDFQRKMMFFLSDIKITGVKTNVEDLDTILIAASAVIPVFGFEEWDYGYIDEVMLYPTTFNEGFQFDNQAEDKRILGMVGSGILDGKMIQSRNALRNGFRNHTDKLYTAIH